jgi:mannose-6-phosphate isomerase-like protein (cupin superfamily)
MKNTINKVFTDFDNLQLDYNNLFSLLSDNTYVSKVYGNIASNNLLNNNFKVEDVHEHPFFKEILKKIIHEFKLFNKKIDIYLFLGMLQGSSSDVHTDPYDVYLYNLYGETMYIINKRKYFIKQGDLIKINKGEVHQGISINPRITLSLGVFE